MRLVSVVTSVRSPFAARLRISFSRSVTCPRAGLMWMTGSTSPVGRMTCSTTSPPVFSSSYGPGVADRHRHVLHPPLELVELQRAVVERAGQAEAVLDQRLLAAAVAGEHAANLRQGDVRFVDDQEEIFGEEVDERVRRLARLAAGEPAGVVLDAGAVADLAQHLEVVAAAGLEPLGFEQLALGLELLEPLVQFLLDALDRLLACAPPA